MRWLAVAFLLFLAGRTGAGLVWQGCDELVVPDTARGDVCDTVGTRDELGWWALVLAPAAVFLLAALPRFSRRHFGVTALAVLVALVAVDGILIAIVTGNLFSSNTR